MLFKPVPLPRKHTRKHLTLDEWRAMLACVERSNDLQRRVLLRLLYETGMRASEPGELLLDHCKLLHHNRLYVPRAKGSTSGWVDLEYDTVLMLGAWINQAYPVKAQRRPNQHVFPGRAYRGAAAGISRSFVRSVVKQLAIEAGVPDYVAHPHAIRHARSVHLLEAADAADLPYEVAYQTIAMIVGHRSAATTIQHYAATIGRGKALADRVLAAALGKES